MKLSAVLLTCAMAVLPVTASSQDWPNRPLRIVVNSPAASATDVVARAISNRLAAALGQPVIVENRPGANGNLGVETVVRAAPDGYTLLHTSGSTIAINPHLYRTNFDVARDLVAVAPTMRNSIWLVVRADSQARTAADLIAQARATPGKLNYGSSGVGSGMHIAAEMMLKSSRTAATHIPFKGSPETLNALLAGQIDFAFDPGPSLAHVRAGKMRLLGTARGSRSPFHPDVPTIAEAGAESDVDTVFGIYVPAQTPPQIVQRLNREIGQAMDAPEVAAVLKTLSAEPMKATPEEFSARQAKDRERFGRFIRASGITAE